MAIAMPTSTYSHISAIVAFIESVRPDSILDIGLGNGKMGFIARDLLDVMLGERHRRETWRVQIDGIEVFADYIQAHQKAIYDDIHIGDAFELIDELGTYDLVILGDVLEHFDKDRAREFLGKCFAHSNKNVLLNIPLGEKWTQDAVYGNPHEQHLSFWERHELEPLATNTFYCSFPGIGDYGSFLFSREKYMHWSIREKAEALAAQGKLPESIAFMESSLADWPGDRALEYLLVGQLLRAERHDDARERLKRVQALFPDDPAAARYINILNRI